MTKLHEKYNDPIFFLKLETIKKPNTFFIHTSLRNAGQYCPVYIIPSMVHRTRIDFFQYLRGPRRIYTVVKTPDRDMYPAGTVTESRNNTPIYWYTCKIHLERRPISLFGFTTCMPPQPYISSTIASKTFSSRYQSIFTIRQRNTIMLFWKIQSNFFDLVYM